MIGSVLVVSVVVFVIGWLWYGPLFGKMWMKLSKISAIEVSKAKKKGMTGKLVLNFIGTFVTAFVFAKILTSVGAASAVVGAVTGFWIWLGFFAATTLLGSVLWENKPWGLFVLNGLYWLVSLLVMGALLVAWS